VLAVDNWHGLGTGVDPERRVCLQTNIHAAAEYRHSRAVQ
jgi:hypothetical protein